MLGTMPVMKRVWRTILLVCAGLALLAPVSFGLNSAGITARDATALAVGSGPKPDPTVCVALPIIGGQQGKCPAGQQEISNDAAKGGAIVIYAKFILNLMSTLIVIVIIMMLIVAGIQYITSVGDPTAIKAAKNRIVNAITALVMFVMAYAVLNFIIPGGIL
jgi:hypothetical protein